MGNDTWGVGGAIGCGGTQLEHTKESGDRLVMIYLGEEDLDQWIIRPPFSSEGYGRKRELKVKRDQQRVSVNLEQVD